MNFFPPRFPQTLQQLQCVAWNPSQLEDACRYFNLISPGSWHSENEMRSLLMAFLTGDVPPQGGFQPVGGWGFPRTAQELHQHAWNPSQLEAACENFNLISPGTWHSENEMRTLLLSHFNRPNVPVEYLILDFPV